MNIRNYQYYKNTFKRTLWCLLLILTWIFMCENYWIERIQRLCKSYIRNIIPTQNYREFFIDKIYYYYPFTVDSIYIHIWWLILLNSNQIYITKHTIMRKMVIEKVTSYKSFSLFFVCLNLYSLTLKLFLKSYVIYNFLQIVN